VVDSEVMKFANIKCIIGAKVICVDQAIGACNIVSVKVQSTSKPALRPMERSGIGLSAGRRPLQEPETGLVGARPQLDNGGVKI
jgi:hypothetical protein